MKKKLLLLCCCALTSSAYSQTPRLTDRNTLGWFVYSGDHRVTEKWAVHTEYQWRRMNWVRAPQQQLARLGVVHTLSQRVEASGGYTYFQTHRYGEYPTVPNRPEPEHRLYEDISLADKLGRVSLTHRIRLEQRWLGTRAREGQGRVQEWAYQNRIRYQLSGQYPLKGAAVDDGEWYVNAFDELFMGFGRNVGNNVFNQNRLSGGLGYQFTSNAKVELNYLFQISQHATPEPASQRPVFEINNGFRLNVLYDLDLTHGKAL
ncbi:MULTISPECIES: DUF2490 domain-containing protein [Hymenobacter]|uniref:DUF2490 domain-containing protein n=1 Tax=Hymenobacter mucosus TaxID=1411120 RepID=A0A238VBL1_9BACT|nr:MULTISPECIES: DUF2490 domain-containing protein [Hymenobacter]SNR31568.1 Protein of unknown function [Hymenobacter mucosus]